MILNSAARFESWLGANILWNFDHCTGIIPEPSSLRGSTMGTRAAEPVTGACKLIDGCSLKLCSTTPSVVSSGRNEVNSTAWLSGWPHHEIKPAKCILHYRLPENKNWFQNYVVCLQQQVFSGFILPKHTFKEQYGKPLKYRNRHHHPWTLDTY